MSDETPTAESIIGTVVGKMMALRKGPNHHVKEVAEAVVQQIDLLRTLLQSQAERIDGLLEQRELSRTNGRRLESTIRKLQEENATLRASSDPDDRQLAVVVWLEFCASDEGLPSGPGWYWHAEEYPEDGAYGPFDSWSAAALNAEQIDSVVNYAEGVAVLEQQITTLRATAELVERADAELGAPPCECCTKKGTEPYWHQECDCMNQGDLADAAGWCAGANLLERKSDEEKKI